MVGQMGWDEDSSGDDTQPEIVNMYDEPYEEHPIMPSETELDYALGRPLFPPEPRSPPLPPPAAYPAIISSENDPFVSNLDQALEVFNFLYPMSSAHEGSGPTTPSSFPVASAHPYQCVLMLSAIVSLTAASQDNATVAPPQVHAENPAIHQADVEDSATPEADIDEVSFIPQADVDGDSATLEADTDEDSVIPQVDIEDSAIPQADVETTAIPKVDVETSAIPLAAVENSAIPQADVEDSAIAQADVDENSAEFCQGNVDRQSAILQADEEGASDLHRASQSLRKRKPTEECNPCDPTHSSAKVRKTEMEAKTLRRHQLEGDSTESTHSDESPIEVHYQCSEETSRPQGTAVSLASTNQESN